MPTAATVTAISRTVSAAASGTSKSSAARMTKSRIPVFLLHFSCSRKARRQNSRISASSITYSYLLLPFMSVFLPDLSTLPF